MSAHLQPHGPMSDSIAEVLIGTKLGTYTGDKHVDDDYIEQVAARLLTLWRRPEVVEALVIEYILAKGTPQQRMTAALDALIGPEAGKG